MRERTVPISAALSFESEGLVIGAGTVLAPTDFENEVSPPRKDEERLLALLAVAYGRKMPPSILGQIDRATQCWKRGEECLALIHLAFAGLHRVEDRRETARRLFMADGLMKAGVQPHSILQALDLAPAEEPFHRFLDSEARVPAGSGGVSGEWTKTASVLAGLTEAAAEFLLNAAKSGLSENPYSLAFGLILIPRGSDLRTSRDVPEIPGLRYAWNRDETTLNLTYDGQHGQRRIDAMLGMDGTFHDGDRVAARLLSGGTLVIDPAEVSSDLADKDGPNLCPKPSRIDPAVESRTRIMRIKSS